MQQSVRRIKKKWYSDVLVEMAKKVKYKQLYDGVMSKKAHCSLCLFRREGIAEIAPSSVVELNRERVIEVDVDSHALLRVNGEEVSGIEHNRVLNLSDDGERWEGDVLQNKPSGWGVLYDSENRMVYEGFRIGDMSVCYGRSYYPDIHTIEYEGMIYEGKRWGRGVQYDRNGKTVFEGEWMNGEPVEKTVTITDESGLFPTCVEELVIDERSLNKEEWFSFDLSVFSHLRELRVNNGCCHYVEEVKLIGLHELERVVIGDSCFTNYHEGEMNPNRRFYLKNCERLRELKMGDHSFSDYSVCEIENVPSLEVIEMDSNFHDASLELKSGFQRIT